MDICIEKLIEDAKTCSLNLFEGSLKIIGTYEGESFTSVNIKTDISDSLKEVPGIEQLNFTGSIKSVNELLKLVPDWADDLRTNPSISKILKTNPI